MREEAPVPGTDPRFIEDRTAALLAQVPEQHRAALAPLAAAAASLAIADEHLAAARALVADLEARRPARVDARDAAVREVALARVIPASAIAPAAGLGVQRVYQIRDGRR